MLLFAFTKLDDIVPPHATENQGKRGPSPSASWCSRCSAPRHSPSASSTSADASKTFALRICWSIKPRDVSFLFRDDSFLLRWREVDVWKNHGDLLCCRARKKVLCWARMDAWTWRCCPAFCWVGAGRLWTWRCGRLPGGAAGFREVQLGDATRSSVEEAQRAPISGDLLALAPPGEALDEGR